MVYNNEINLHHRNVHLQHYFVNTYVCCSQKCCFMSKQMFLIWFMKRTYSFLWDLLLDNKRKHFSKEKFLFEILCMTNFIIVSCKRKELLNKCKCNYSNYFSPKILKLYNTKDYDLKKNILKNTLQKYNLITHTLQG